MLRVSALKAFEISKEIQIERWMNVFGNMSTYNTYKVQKDKNWRIWGKKESKIKQNPKQ